jgi:CTP synthase (UTP-ammonia lyase)
MFRSIINETWQQTYKMQVNDVNESIKIGIIGDFDSERQSHTATNEALLHCAAFLGFDVSIHWLPTDLLVGDAEVIRQFDCIWCAPGIYNNINGAISAIHFAREHDIPFIGTCAGFQFTVIEYARDVSGLTKAGHEEYNPKDPDLIITLLSCSLVGQIRKILINTDSKAYQYYGRAEVEERFTCNYGLNQEYKNLIFSGGLRVAGTDEHGEVRILELPQNKFFIATLFQPQLSSLPANPHKLILAFLTHTREHHRAS